MALTKCRECGNTVSTEANACPHCGAPRPATIAAPPSIPRQPLPEKKKARGLLRSCLLTVVLGFGAFILLAVILAIFSGGPEKKQEPKMDQKAEAAKKVRLEQRRQLEISNLVDALSSTNLVGEARLSKIKSLMALDPNTREFPTEVAAIREEIERTRKQANEFVNTAIGKKVPVEKWPEYGAPETMSDTDNKYWVAYLPRLDVSFVSRKDSDTVIFAARGRQSATTYLENKKIARRKEIEQGFSVWDGSHTELTRVIKQSMNDPKSYEHDKTVYIDMDDYLLVTTTFRGKNAFGGVIRNSCKAKCGLDGKVIEVLYIGP